MPEIRIYLAEDLHTEQLQEASRDLLMQNLQVTGKCTANLQLLSPRLSPEIVHARVRQLVHPHYITNDILSQWNNREAWVSRMLVKASSLSYPEHTDSKLGEHLHQIDQFTTVEAALGFLYTVELRLKNLLSMKVPQQLGSIKYGADAYVESRILRKAIFNGVFLTNPKLAVSPFNPSVN